MRGSDSHGQRTADIFNQNDIRQAFKWNRCGEKEPGYFRERKEDYCLP